jgi:hypothetical protein
MLLGSVHGRRGYMAFPGIHFRCYLPRQIHVTGAVVLYDFLVCVSAGIGCSFSCLIDECRPNGPPHVLPALRRTPHVGEVLTVDDKRSQW